MKRLLSAIILLLILLVRAEARLGETKEQLEERYGKPSNEEDTNKNKVMWFDKDPFKITCFLRENKVYGISYKKKVKWTDEEIMQVLNKNTGQGVEWKKMSAGFNVTQIFYKTTDGLRVALYSIFEDNLMISFQSDVQKASEEASEEKKKNMDAL